MRPDCLLFTFFSSTPRVPFSSSKSRVSSWQSLKILLMRAWQRHSLSTTVFVFKLCKFRKLSNLLQAKEWVPQRWNFGPEDEILKEQAISPDRKRTPRRLFARPEWGAEASVFVIFQWTVVTSSGPRYLFSDIQSQDKNPFRSEKKCLLGKKKKNEL